MKLELWMSWVVGFLAAILVFVLTFLLVCWIASRSKLFEMSMNQNIDVLAVALLALSIFAFFGAHGTLHLVYDKTNPGSEEETVLYEIVSMNDAIASTGGGNRTYISIDAEQFYTFYYKYGDGYRTGKISADNTIVYQTDETNPCIVEKISRKACGKIKSTEYDIYIPKGSIIENFHLD